MRVQAKHKIICLLVSLVLFLYMDNFFAKIMGANEQVRQPRFAGSWYPSQTQVLDGDLSQYLKEAGKTQKSNLANVLAIIVPHMLAICFLDKPPPLPMNV